MLIDGIHVIVKGKYIGPEEPGPWSLPFKKFKLNVFRLGPLFLLYGLFWIYWLYLYWRAPVEATRFGLILSFFTLWYFPVGSFCSLLIFIILWLSSVT